MNHVFEMKINPYMGNAEIQLDGQPISAKSQLRNCAIDNFFSWYKKIPEQLYAEVNDSYALRVECSEIQFVMLKAVLSDKTQCRDISFKPFVSKYSMGQRIGWMCDAARELGITLPSIPGFSLKSMQDTVAVVTRIRKRMKLDYAQYCTSLNGAMNIWISSVNTYKQCLAQSSSTDDLVIVTDNCESKIKAYIDNCVVVSASESKIPVIVEQWVNLMILEPYLVYGYDCLIHSNRAKSFECEAKIKMLIGELPIIKSKMPDRVECGTSINIDIQEFPQSELSLRISDNSILKQQGVQLKAEKPGITKIEIVSDQGAVLLSQNIEVFYVNRVTDIDLFLPTGSNVLVGDIFHVVSKWKPANAVNVNKAVWSSSPIGILRDIGGGNFEALSPGQCIVTLTIEKIKKNISIKVVSLPKDIQMATEIKLKLNQAMGKFSATLLPVGSACRIMDVRILDPNIAVWDQSTKKIIPKAEGITELVVSAYDAKGLVVVKKKCKIEILPEKDIITPPAIPSLMIVCIALAVLTFGSEMFVWCILGGLGLSIAEAVLNIVSYIGKQAVVRKRYGLLVGAMGIIGFGCCMAWYFGMFG